MGGGKNYTFVYTELGVAMLSGLLNSDVAINVNISIIRAFVTMRNYVSSVSLTANHQVLVFGLRNSGSRYFFFRLSVSPSFQ